MRHRFSAVRSTPSRQVSHTILPALARLALLIAILWIGLITPAAAQEETPFPRIGDTPGTAAGCNELLVNGGFEVPDLGWQPLTPALPPELSYAYVPSPVFAGTQALRIGIVEGTNTAITSGVYQTVDLPPQASPIVLSFRYLPKHETNPGSDLQFLDIVDETTGERTRLWAGLANQEMWLFSQINLTQFQGRRVRVEFGVSNNGSGGRTALYLDQVSLQSCPTTPAPTPTGLTLTPSPTAVTTTVTPTPIVIEINTPTPTLASPFPTTTPTPFVSPPASTVTSTPMFVTPTPSVVTSTPTVVTPTPILSPTPLPPGCVSNIIINDSFEEALDDHGGWILGNDPVPPRLNGETAFDGLRSLRLGNPPGPGSQNVKTYSSVRQLITVPHTVITAKLLWAHQSFTQAPAPQHIGLHDDRQELILLTPELVTKEILYRQLRNDTVWLPQTTDLTPYIGETFFIYFNVFNNGDGLRTWMNLDAVRLELCFSVSPTPTYTPLSTTPTPTPVSTVDAVERAAPNDGERTLDEGPPPDEPLEVIEPEDVQNTAEILSALGNFLIRNWEWALGFLVVAWLVWRFVLR